MEFKRKWLNHTVPFDLEKRPWFFITICAKNRGSNEFCHDGMPKAIFEASKHYHENGNWWIYLMLLMPDHIHTIASFSDDQKMSTTIGSWKRFLTRSYGLHFQKGFFDHRLRTNESIEEKAHYIVENPVRANLVEHASNWKYQWRFD